MGDREDEEVDRRWVRPDDRVRYYFVIDRLPAGEAPTEVKQQWIGLALPVRYERKVEGPDPYLGFGAESRRPATGSDGIRVRLDDCIDALTRAERTGAAAYWEAKWAARPFTSLVFQPSEGHLMTIEVARRFFPELDEGDDRS